MSKRDSSERLYDAIGEAKDNFIEEMVGEDGKTGKRPDGRRNGPGFLKITGLIAAAVAIAFIVRSFITPVSDSQLKAMAEVRYPESFSYDDHDKRIKVMTENALPEGYTDSVNGFAYKTAAMFLKDKNKNLNYSPLSLYFALSVALEGASGDTQKEIAGLLNVSDPSKQADNAEKLYRTLYYDNEIGKEKIANSLWLDDEVRGVKFNYNQDFIKRAAEKYFAGSFNADHSKEATGRKISEWIKENTGGTLTPDIKADPDKVMSIINTVYFKDQWTDRFDEKETVKDKFNLKDGKTVEVSFMNRDVVSGSFSRSDKFLRASLGLKNGGNMTFILPSEGVSPYDLLKNESEVKNTFEGGDSLAGQIIWKIPKFRFGNENDLKEGLKALGMTTSFDPERSDFSKIADKRLFISDVKQGSMIGIDEKGVEASSFTDLSFSTASMPVDKAEMILDRPFIFGITSRNGSLLFVGVVENPESAD